MLVALMARRRLPPGVDAVVETLSVEEPEPVIVVGFNVAVTPAGVPMAATDRATVPLNPFNADTDTVPDELPPGVKAIVPGDAVTEKFAAVVLDGARVSIRPCPLGVPQPVTRS